MGTGEARQNRSAAKRAAILAAAMARFRREGFTRAAMEDVARDAQVSTATLYRHFASKAALFEAVCAQSVETLEAGLPPSGGPPLEHLEVLAVSYAGLLNDPETRGAVRMLIAETGAGGELSARFHAAVKMRLAHHFVGTVQRAFDMGALAGDEPANRVAGQLMGMIEHATLMPGLIMGDDAPGQDSPETVAHSALKTWYARWANHA
ncbi:MAG: TetR/AcrR family transcriptional regulator [Alphaproteobacteria bacterium]